MEGWLGAQGLRWGVERRLEHIESRLYWHGTVNRADLIDAFGVSVHQASADFAKYLEMAPGNAEYDRSRKTYVATAAFSPVIFRPDAGRYLSTLRLVGDGIVLAEEAGMPDLPAFDVVPGPDRRISAEVLRAVLAAIRGRLSLIVLYQSMSSPEPEWRLVSPHALAWDGFRWHVRGRCERDLSYKDFVLARISGVGETARSEADPAGDAEWHERVRVIIGPHPGLSEGQRKAIEADYAMTGGVSVIDVRRAFLYYLVRRFGLDVDPAQRRPQDQHVVLLNRDEVMEALAPKARRDDR